MTKKKKGKTIQAPTQGSTLAEVLSNVMAAQMPRLTDQDVADAIGSSRVTVSYLRRGVHKGSQGTILSLWEYLKTLDSTIKLETLMAKESRR